jgi:hypothetical protein
MKPKFELPLVLPDDGEDPVAGEDVDFAELPSVGVHGNLDRDSRRDPTPIAVQMSRLRAAVPGSAPPPPPPAAGAAPSAAPSRPQPVEPPPSAPNLTALAAQVHPKPDRSISLQGLVRVRSGDVDRMISSGSARLSPSSLFLPMERPLEVGSTVDVEARTPTGVLRFEGVVLEVVERAADHHGGVRVSVAPADAFTRRYLQQLAAGNPS